MYLSIYATAPAFVLPLADHVLDKRPGVLSSTVPVCLRCQHRAKGRKKTVLLFSAWLLQKSRSIGAFGLTISNHNLEPRTQRQGNR
jgi:hypothetical protein